MTKALLFDLGGTLDADGVPWKERFLALFQEQGVEVSPEAFAPHFYDADDALVGTVPAGTTLAELAQGVGTGVAERLGQPREVGVRVGRRFAEAAYAKLAENARLLRSLRERYRLGVVSNFYGNLPAVLAEVNLAPLLEVAVDSVTVGVTKPDPGLFRAAIDAMGLAPREALFVGDSPPRDMAGARALDMPHVWLAGPRPGPLAGCCPWDRVIRRLEELPVALGERALVGGVIAAGEGSRLKRDGFAMSKPLVPVGGEPLLVHAVENLLSAGVRTLCVIVNESEEDCADLLRSRYRGLGIGVIVKTTPHSLASFREVLSALPPGRALVTTVDAFCAREHFASFALQASALPETASALAVTPLVADEKPLWVTEESSGRLSAIGGASGTAVTAGFYLISQRARDLTPPPGLGRLREYLTWLVDAGEDIRGVRIDAVIDVDRAEDVALAEELARKMKETA